MRAVRAILLLKLGALAGMLAGAAFVRRAVPSRGDEDSNEVALVAVLNGIDLKSRATAFTGGSMLAWFGGIHVDLAEAELAPEALLSLNAFCGGIAIEVPRGWRVDARVKGLGGGANLPDADDGPPDAPVLTIEGTALFGGIAVMRADEDGAGEPVEAGDPAPAS